MSRLPLSALAPLAALWALSVPATADVTAYCPGPPNSVGAGAVLTWRGPADPAQAQLVVEGLPPGSPLVYVYGQSRQQTPFGAGRLCVGPVAFVLARRAADAAGVSILRIVPEGEQEDVRWLVSGLLTGANFQVLYRDAGIPGGASTSSALEVVFE
jgi:hypothetical protein